MYDIFLSYAHLDDTPINHRYGWITRFHQRLNKQLAMEMGRKVHIYRDAQLNPCELLWPTIAEKIADSAIFLIISTPRYHTSLSCSKEVKYFTEIHGSPPLIGNTTTSRILKIGKTYHPRNQQLPELQPLLSIDFFNQHELNDRIYHYWDEEDRTYGELVSQLSQQLRDSLNQFYNHQATVE